VGRSRSGGSKRWGSSRSRDLAKLMLATYGDVCWLCGQPGATTVDHVVPLQYGGSPYDLTNVRPAHSACNTARGNRTRHYRHRTVVAAGHNTTSRDW
jgi:5-methylcytosine-specific restriction endonuclease McrA